MVDAASERQVRALAASDIQTVGILEDVRIPVGRAEKQDDVVTFARKRPVHERPVATARVSLFVARARRVSRQGACLGSFGNGPVFGKNAGRKDDAV